MQSEVEYTMYIVGGKKHTEKLQVHPLQACFVVAHHSSGDLMRIIFTINYIQYNLHNIHVASAKFKRLVVA